MSAAQIARDVVEHRHEPYVPATTVVLADEVLRLRTVLESIADCDCHAADEAQEALDGDS